MSASPSDRVSTHAFGVRCGSVPGASFTHVLGLLFAVGGGLFGLGCAAPGATSGDKSSATCAIVPCLNGGGGPTCFDREPEGDDILECGRGGGGVACFVDYCGAAPRMTDAQEACWRAAGGGACFEQRSEVRDPPTGAWRTGLYVVDGTLAHPGHQNVVSRLFESYSGHKTYVRGPVLDGSNSDAIRDFVAERICADLDYGHIDGFAILGYSRGAIIALEASMLARERCDRAAAPGAFVWAGFLDAVDTSITHYTKRVPGEVPFLHVRKSSDFEHVLTTVDFEGEGEVLRIDTSHNGISCEDPAAADEAWDALRRHSWGRRGMAWTWVDPAYDCSDTRAPRGAGCGPMISCGWPGW